MDEISKEEFIERTKKSRPYPLGDQALESFLKFLESHEDEYQSVRVLLRLARLQESAFEGHRILIFDDPKIQRAFFAMGEDLPEEFASFTFSDS